MLGTAAEALTHRGVARFLGVTLALALASGVASPAAAEAAPQGPRLELRHCPALNSSALRELIALELRTLALANSQTQLNVTCSGELAIVSLADPADPRFAAEARLDLAGSGPGARERLVALAATELVAQAERGQSQLSERAPPAQPAQVEAVPKRPVAQRRPELFLGAGLSLMGRPATLLWGAQLDALLPIAGSLSLGLGLRLERGSTRTQLADIAWTLPSGALTLVAERRFRSLRLAAGAGARAGRLRLSASAAAPNTGQELSGTLLSLVVPGRASLALSRHVSLGLAFEGGYLLGPVRGTIDHGATLLEAAGAWAAAGFGIGASF